MKRREFIKVAGAAIPAAGMADRLFAASGDGKKPNIILIYTDQQSASMMSCAGNPHLKTPAMDYLAENGMRFTRAYTTNPVCVPARPTDPEPGPCLSLLGQTLRQRTG